MGLAWTLLLNGPLAAGAYAAARGLFRQPPGLPRLFAACVLAWSWVILGCELTSLITRLDRPGLLVWSLLGLILGALSLLLPAPSQEPEAGPTNVPQPFDTPSRLGLGLTISAFTLLFIPSLLGPVKVVTDGPIYHLYFAVQWWKARALELVPVPFGESAATYFPANGDLWFAWLLVGWDGDRLARVGQAPFLVVAGMVVYALAIRLGARRFAALIAACWFATCMPLLLFSFEPNVDTIFTAGYLLAFWFFLEYAQGAGGRRSLALSRVRRRRSLGHEADRHGVYPPAPGPRGHLYRLSRNRRRLDRCLRHRDFARLATAHRRLLVRPQRLAHRQPPLPGRSGRPRLDRLVRSTGHEPEPLLHARDLLAGPGRYPAGRLRPSARAPVGPRPAGSLAPGSKPGRPARLLGFGPPPRWPCSISCSTGWSDSLSHPAALHAPGLGLAALPLALLVDRSRWLAWLAAAVLALHLLTPHPWPFAAPPQSPPGTPAPSFQTPSPDPRHPPRLALGPRRPRGGRPGRRLDLDPSLGIPWSPTFASCWSQSPRSACLCLWGALWWQAIGRSPVRPLLPAVSRLLPRLAEPRTAGRPQARPRRLRRHQYPLLPVWARPPPPRSVRAHQLAPRLAPPPHHAQAIARASPTGPTPAPAGTGSRPTSTPGSRTCVTRRSTSSSSPAPIPTRARITRIQPIPSASPSNENGLSRTPEISSPLMAWPKATPASALTESCRPRIPDRVQHLSNQKFFETVASK